MEPFSTMLMLGAGLVAQGYGMYETNKAGKEANAAQVKMIQQEQQIENQRRQAMELDAQRKVIENERNRRKAAAAGEQAAVSQGAGASSGYFGGQAQVEGEAGWNLTGITKNLEIGENIFNINQQLSMSKIDYANAQRKMQEGQGWMSLGQSLASASPAFGKLTSGFGNTNWGQASSFFGPSGKITNG